MIIGTSAPDRRYAMTFTRAHLIGSPVLFAVGVVTGIVLHRCAAREDARLVERLDAFAAEFREHLDEVCARLHDLRQRPAYPGPPADDCP